MASIHDAYYVVGYLNTYISLDLIDATYVNSNSQYCDFTEAEFDAVLQRIIDIYEYQMFYNYDHTN
jgi:hypothetical protein